jgi:hypothetical protein
MTYSYRRRKSPEAMGFSWSDVTNLVQKTASTLQTAADVAKAAPGVVDAVQGVVQDPYLKEFVCNVQRLKAIQAGQYPGPPCPPTPGPIDPKKGIGLGQAIMPLHVVIFLRQNPWVVPLLVGGIIGLPFFLGVAVGKRRRK